MGETSNAPLLRTFLLLEALAFHVAFYGILLEHQASQSTVQHVPANRF